MNDPALEIRMAARRGHLNQVDPSLLTLENVIRCEDDGTIQSAAAHGQLRFLPPEARTVRALLDCGHPERGNLKLDGTHDDAFYQAVIENQLGNLPQDAQFKADLLTYRTEVEDSVERAVRTLKFIERSHNTALSDLRAKQGIPLGAATTAARTWMAQSLSSPALPVADLPEIASVPMNLPVATPSGDGVAVRR